MYQIKLFTTDSPPPPLLKVKLDYSFFFIGGCGAGSKMYISIKSTKIGKPVWVSSVGAEICEYFFVNEIKNNTLDEYPALKNLVLFY